MANKLSVISKSPSSGLEQATEDYLAHVKAKGGSPRTEMYYSDVLRTVFLPWASSVDLHDPGQLSQRDLDAFNAELLGRKTKAGKPLSKASVGSYLRATRAFIAWLKASELASTKLMVKQVKAPRKVLDTLDRSEINAMESAAVSERDKLIVRILGDAGLRLAELLALTPSSLVELGRDRLLKVEGKGSRERLVPLSPAVYQRLKRYAEKGRPADCYTDRIFISVRRRAASGGYEALDARAVQQLLRGVATRAGIKKPINPHSFRHSWVTNSLRAGMNPLLVARIAGHSSLAMIESTYEHLNMADANREMMRALMKDN